MSAFSTWGDVHAALDQGMHYFAKYTVGKPIFFGAIGWVGWGPASPSSNVANSDSVNIALPWTCPRDVEVDAMMVSVQVAAAAASGSVARMALYDADVNTGDGDVLLRDCASVSVETTGTKTTTFSTPVTLRKFKRYWSLIQFDLAGATNPTFGAAGTNGADPYHFDGNLGDNNWRALNQTFGYANAVLGASPPSTLAGLLNASPYPPLLFGPRVSTIP